MIQLACAWSSFFFWLEALIVSFPISLMSQSHHHFEATRRECCQRPFWPFLRPPARRSYHSRRRCSIATRRSYQPLPPPACHPLTCSVRSSVGNSLVGFAAAYGLFVNRHWTCAKGFGHIIIFFSAEADDVSIVIERERVGG